MASYAMPGYSMSSPMPSHPSSNHMSQTFQPTQYPVQGQSSWIPAQHPGSTLPMHGNLFTNQMLVQGQMSSQMPPGNLGVMYNQMEGQTSSFANTVHGQSHVLANQMFSQPHFPSNQNETPSLQTQSLWHQQQNLTGHRLSTQPRIIADDEFGDFSHSVTTNVPVTQSWGLIDSSVGNTATVPTLATSSASNHPVFQSSVQASFVPNAQAPASAAIPGAFAPASSAPSLFVAPVSSSSASTDEFQGFASFDIQSNHRENDFGEFGSFAETETKEGAAPVRLATTTTIASVTQNPGSAVSSTTQEDDFGDFGSFAQPLPSGQTSAHATTAKPLAQSFDGKRMNIVVKKNLGAVSAGDSHKELKISGSHNNSITKDKSSVRVAASQPVKKSSHVSRPGLEDLADKLTQAKNQLSAPVPPPAEEQQDFHILQQVINAKSSIPPVVQETDTSFKLPDNPIQLAEIFPKCTPKRASQPDIAVSIGPHSHLGSQQATSMDGSFGGFATFAGTDNQNAVTTAEVVENSNDESFGGFATFSNTDVQVNLSKSQEAQDFTITSNDESFGGFAAFSPTPSDMQRESADEFGDFSSSNPKTGENQRASSQTHTEAVTKIKSHAVDWSAFSALDALRAEEEEGNLGDFSVFGSTLKEISSVEQPQQPNFLLSPEDTPLDTVVESQGKTDTSKKEEETGDSDDWAAFAEPASAAQHVTFSAPISSEDDWAAFSQPPEPVESYHSVADPSQAVLFSKPLSKPERDPPHSDLVPPLSNLSSKPLFEVKSGNDIIDDNDSDWSGFAGPVRNQPDNISSDWSFKDNASVQEDGKSVSSGSTTAHSKVNNDLTESFKPDSDWPIEIPSLTDIQSPEDEWAAFGSIDRSKEHVSAESSERSRSSTIKDQSEGSKGSTTKDLSEGSRGSTTKDLSEGSKGQDFVADFTFASSPPPFSPATPTSSLTDIHSSRQLHSSNHVLEGTGDVSTDTNNKAELVMEDNCVTLTSEPDDEEWGNFGNDSRGLSESPDLFSPPPLTEGDFSPHKHVAEARSDWFSFPSAQQSSSPARDIVKVELIDQGDTSNRFGQNNEKDEEKGFDAICSITLTDQTLCEAIGESSSDEQLSFSDEFKMSHTGFNSSDNAENASKEFINPSNNFSRQEDFESHNFNEPPPLTDSNNYGKTTTTISEQTLTHTSASSHVQEEDDSFMFDEPPPFTDDTPGEEMPPFGIPQQYDITDDDDFSMFALPSFNKGGVGQTAAAAAHKEGKGDIDNDRASPGDNTPAMTHLSENRGCHSIERSIDGIEPKTVPSNEPSFSMTDPNLNGDDWASPNDFQNSQKANSIGWNKEKELSTHGEDEWAFGNDTEELEMSPQPPPGSAETSSIASKGDDSDWAFPTANNGTDDDDQWSFKSPDIRSTGTSSPALSPPVVSPRSSPSPVSLQSATVSPRSPPSPQGSATTSPTMRNTSPQFDDADFGEFADDDFQAFDSSEVPADPADSTSSGFPSLSDNQDKITMLLNSSFKCPSPLGTVASSRNKLTEMLTSNGAWGSLKDLNQSVSLKLQWRESRCHINLLSSLSGGHMSEHSPVGSSQPLQPTSLLPPTTVNGPSSTYQMSSSREVRGMVVSPDGSGSTPSSSTEKKNTGFTDLL
ncbi:uncharacterized protein [Watersipora subatra]|uniref:uncharacterized protein n=1 Tax=Watersipora subatra TaxID=2589382 RepID=UPI00355C791B